MSLFDRFTIGYQIEKEQKRSSSFNITSTNNEIQGKIRSNISENPQKEILYRDIIENLMELGFNIPQIMVAFKAYKFNTLDDAVYIMMKDVETGKYNHRFFSSENKDSNNLNRNENSKIISKSISKNNDNEIKLTINNPYSSEIGKKCAICNGFANEHIDFELREIKLEIGNINKKIIEDDNINKKKNSCKNLSNYNSEDKINQIDSSINMSTLINATENKLSKLNEQLKPNHNLISNNRINNLGNYFQNKKLEETKVSDNNNNTSKKKINIVTNINLDKETLDLFEDHRVCRICFSERIAEANRAEFACGHQFCRKCVINYLTSCIDNGRVY